MKKTLVMLLALMFILAVSSAAFAQSANPFSDVPKDHWAYAAVDKLAKAGVVDGYGDGTYRGDRAMTRYEMAQVVAKAMARSDKADAENKALIDKLAVEFASELNNLGVRVSKLEEKTKIALTYESRIRYAGDDNEPADMQGSNAFDFRQRIYLNGDVNDKVAYGARLETGNVAFGSGSTTTLGFDRAYFTIKDFLFDSTTLGRFGTFGATNGLLQGRTGNLDGIKVVSALSPGITFIGAFVDAKPYSKSEDYGWGSSEVALGNLVFKLSDKTQLNFGYQTNNMSNINNWPVVNPTADIQLKTRSYDIGAWTKIGNVYLTGEYVNTKIKGASFDVTDDSAKAYCIQLTNGVSPLFYPSAQLTDPTKAHTDAFSISYRKMDAYSVPATSVFLGVNPIAAIDGGSNNTLAQDNDVKGYFFTYQNTLSKGVVFTVEYQDLEQKSNDQNKDKVYNASLQFYF